MSEIISLTDWSWILGILGLAEMPDGRRVAERCFRGLRRQRGQQNRGGEDESCFHVQIYCQWDGAFTSLVAQGTDVSFPPMA